MDTKKQQELDTIKRRFEIFYEFFIKHGSNMNSAMDMAKNIMENAYNNGKLTDLRRVNKELDVWLLEIPKEKRVELENALAKEFGEVVGKKEADRLKKINKIINSHKIGNLKEYELLHSYEEEIYKDKSKFEVAETIRNMLTEFNKNNA